MKKESGCFVFLDVDNLKKINDTNGHDAGDAALKCVGEALTQNSENCLSCRLGGDEFLIFMKNISREDAETRIKKIFCEFEKKKGQDIKIAEASLSAGMVMCTPADTYSKVYTMADKALYLVKQNGKNSYSFYDKDSDSPVNEQMDMEKFINAIKKTGSYEGALDVEYRQFTKLFEFIGNMEKRFSYPFQLLIITLKGTTEDDHNVDELEKAMFYMEQSIRQTIRNVDIITRYSRSQFLVLLIGTDAKGAKIAIDRIFIWYYKMYGNSNFTPSHLIADIQKEGIEAQFIREKQQR